MVSPIQQISYMEEMDKMGAYAWLRITPAAPNTLKMWYEDANCYDMDPSLFEPSLEAGSPDDIMSREDRLALNEDKMEQARKACSDCPVWHLCYQKARGDDFYYTMRAGMEPGQLTEYKQLGRVNYRNGQEVELCVNGHNDWVIWGKKKPRKKCRECSRLNTQAQKAKRQARSATLDS